MKYFTSDGLYVRDDNNGKEEKMNHIIKKQGTAITFLVLALTMALAIGVWLCTDFVYAEDGDEITNTEAVSEDNGSGGDTAPAENAGNNNNNVEAVPVQEAEPQREEVQRVETAPVDQDAEQQTGGQETPQLRGPANNNPEPTIQYVSTELYYATSFGSAQGSTATLGTTSSGGDIPLDQAFWEASAWSPEYGYNMNPDNPKEAMEFTGELTDEFGHTFYEGDAISTNEVIRLLTESGVSSTYATYKLYAQYVTSTVPDVAKVIGIDGVGSGSFTEEYAGNWTYQTWVYGNWYDCEVGSLSAPCPGAVDGYTFLRWQSDVCDYFPGDEAIFFNADFDENGCLYLTAEWEDADGNIVTELPDQPGDLVPVETVFVNIRIQKDSAAGSTTYITKTWVAEAGCSSTWKQAKNAANQYSPITVGDKTYTFTGEFEDEFGNIWSGERFFGDDFIALFDGQEGPEATLTVYAKYAAVEEDDPDDPEDPDDPTDPEEPDTPDDPEVIDPTDEDADVDDADNDAEFKTVYTETIAKAVAKAEAKAETNEEVTAVDSPETGDGHPILGWIIVFCLGLAGILGGVFRKKN